MTLYGYALGVHAPGEVGMYDALVAAHGQLLGHGLAVQALRAAGVTGGVGITNVHSPVVREGRGIRARLYSSLFDLLHNRIFADPVLLGRYPRVPLPLRSLFKPLLEASREDLATIHQPLDFYGLNYYLPTRVAVGPGEGRTPDGECEAMQGLPFHLAPLPEFEHHRIRLADRPRVPHETAARLRQAIRQGRAPALHHRGWGELPRRRRRWWGG